MKTYSPVWDLEVFFKGGSESKEFESFLTAVKDDLSVFEEKLHQWEVSNSLSDAAELELILNQFAKAYSKLRQAGAFVSCLEAQNSKDKKASTLRAEITASSAYFQNILTKLDEKLTKIDDQVFGELINTDPLRELQFILNERRVRAKEKLSVEEETLITQLGVDGYHGWGQLYDTIVGTITIPFETDGKVEHLSVGQASNKFSHPKREVRQAILTEWEKAWSDKEELFAKALNHLAGFRLSVYKKRGWEEVLKEPLEINRMQKETLESMWGTIAENKEPLVKFLNRKAQLLGVEKLSWSDLDAPLTESEQSTVSYQEGAEFILKHFAKFGEKLTSFTEKAFEDRWIEAEDRPNKRPGGFCTGFPENEQSRIFMTYSGTPSNISTLAHELGHAYHSFALKGTHPLNRGYAMNVAETASMFAEMVVSDASLKEAKNENEKLTLLEDKIQRTVALLMNIHARFLFETRFYEERKKGMVSATKLNELMLEAQKEAYGDALSEYHPTFWASKLHFYITGVPFYNFPYTFGFLFSLG
ncbi:M3 family oligoendopeptidase, partial [Peribacillus acanthi]|uniref:M3 family oligoendopeptidase n=1 Tax=Peribacillus acanthi TaxID=2171554 RepID=UPI001F0BDC66